MIKITIPNIFGCSVESYSCEKEYLLIEGYNHFTNKKERALKALSSLEKNCRCHGFYETITSIKFYACGIHKIKSIKHKGNNLVLILTEDLYPDLQ